MGRRKELSFISHHSHLFFPCLTLAVLTEAVSAMS